MGNFSWPLTPQWPAYLHNLELVDLPVAIVGLNEVRRKPINVDDGMIVGAYLVIRLGEFSDVSLDQSVQYIRDRRPLDMRNTDNRHKKRPLHKSMVPDGWESYSIKSTPCPCFTQSPSCSLFSCHGTYAGKTLNSSDLSMATTMTWSVPQLIDPSGNFASVSCPSPSFCVAVKGSGDVSTYNGVSWSSPKVIDPSGVLVSVSCPTVRFCVAVDYAAKVVIGQA